MGHYTLCQLMGQQVLSESDGARGDEKNGGSSQWAMDRKWGQLYPYSSLSLLLFSVSRGFPVTCCWICNIIILDLKHIDKEEEQRTVLSCRWVPAAQMPCGAQPRNLPQSCVSCAQAQASYLLWVPASSPPAISPWKLPLGSNCS